MKKSVKSIIATAKEYEAVVFEQYGRIHSILEHLTKLKSIPDDLKLSISGACCTMMPSRIIKNEQESDDYCIACTAYAGSQSIYFREDDIDRISYEELDGYITIWVK